jgi:PHD/YefM family antitoxin component YafN of YafNO toxin-antitoxin module
MAHKEPVLVLTSDGEEFILSQADDFDREVEALRNSQTFQKFLEERSQCKARIPLSEIER